MCNAGRGLTNFNFYPVDSYEIGTGMSFDSENGTFSLSNIQSSGEATPGETIIEISDETPGYSDIYVIFRSKNGIPYGSGNLVNYEIAMNLEYGIISISLDLLGEPRIRVPEPESGGRQSYINRYLISWPGPGDLIEYVYSMNNSAYPNGDIDTDKDYYYDQRTTVTSPTAPSGLTCPNPITTSSATVSWSAATSNVPDYPVDLYELSYSTNGGSSWTVAGTTAGTSLEVNIPAGTTSIQFRVRARDSNGQWGSYVTGTASQVLLAPTLTVPQMLMQGQQATINWTAIEGADSYTLQRKANTDSDWVQVYSGTALTFSETAGTWTSVQYRVQAVFDSTPGGWATSAEIPVVSASALVISGQDGDLGTLVNDVPYSISTDTGNQITATVRVNGSLLFSGTVVSGAAMAIPVLDLPTGDGTIVIEASVMSGSSMVTAMRTWTYDKTISGFANHGSTAKLQKDGKYIWPDTIAEAVRMQGGITLDRFIASTVITLTTSGWDQSGGIYKQTVDCPVVWPYAPIIVIDPDLNGEDQDADDSILEAWQSGPGAKGMKQGDGTITFFSASQPTMNIPVRVGVI